MCTGEILGQLYTHNLQLLSKSMITLSCAHALSGHRRYCYLGCPMLHISTLNHDVNVARWFNHFEANQRVSKAVDTLRGAKKRKLSLREAITILCCSMSIKALSPGAIRVSPHWSRKGSHVEPVLCSALQWEDDCSP